MRKNIYIFVVLLIVMMVTSCTSKKSVLQEATGASSKQTKYIEKRLEEDKISYSTVVISSNSVLDGMDTDWHAFDLVDEDGTTHILILRKSDNDFTAVLDSNGRNIDGLIDSGLIPALFENGEYKFQNDK